MRPNTSSIKRYFVPFSSFSAGAGYLHGINCSFSNSSPYFTGERISKLALPSEFTLIHRGSNDHTTGRSRANRGRAAHQLGEALAEDGGLSAVH